MGVSNQIIELNNLVGLDNFLNTLNTHTHTPPKIHRQKNFQARMNHRDHRHFLTIIYRKWFFPGDTRQFKNTARFYFKKANDEVECINRKGIPSLIQKHLLKARSLSSS